MDTFLSELKPEDIRDRVIETKKMRLGDLRSHPYNPRRHPDSQREKVGHLMSKIGYVGGILAYYSERNENQLTLMDGHLRKSLGPDFSGEVIILDINDQEADLLVALYDESGREAEIDTEMLIILRENIETDDEMFLSALSQMAEYHSALFEGDDPLNDEEPGGQPPADGSLLALVDITISEPRHQPEPGQVWRLGQHTLCCCEVFTEWTLWQQYLSEGVIFCPYPGPLVVLSKKADQAELVLVQPDLYIAGHIIDRFSDVYGDKEISCLTS